MQTAMNPVNPALAQVIGALDTIKPVTPEGTPTVAAQVMQAAGMAQQPALPQIAQQAGLGGQIQAMQMQEAQKQLMNAAMQQQRQAPAGLMGLNPQMGNFAEGGIVGTVPGYAGGGSSYADFLRRRREEKERQRSEDAFFDVSPSGEIQSYRQDPEAARAMLAATTPMMPIPEIEVAPQQTAPRVPAPDMVGAPAASGAPRAAAPQGVAALAELARKTYGEMATAPATPEQILEREKRNRAAFDQFLISQGIKPDAFKQREEEDRLLMQQQRDLLRERMQREEGKDTFLSRAGAALRGFSQMKGQGVGGALIGAHENLARQLQAGEIRMDQFRDAEIRLNELEITRRRALDDSRRATAEGRWKDAQQALATEQAASNEIKKLQAATYIPQANAMVQERQAQEAGAARRADQDRINELYRLRLNTLTGGKPPTDEQKMEAMEYALQTVKGAGSAARTAAAGQRLTLDQLRALQKTYAEQAENMLLPQAQRDQAAQMLKQVNDQIAASAGIATPQSGKGSGGPYYAVNPKTGERIMSNDGVNWQPVR